MNHLTVQLPYTNYTDGLFKIIYCRNEKTCRRPRMVTAAGHIGLESAQ